MRTIIIYRHQHFLPSEGFIYQQTKYLREYQPIFVGRTINGELPTPSVNYKLIATTGFANLLRHVFFRSTNSLESLLQNTHPSLIHAHFGVDGVYALPLAKKLAIPLITTFHGFDATNTRKELITSRKISCINYLLHRQELARSGDLFICISNFIRDHLLTMGFPEEKLLTHYIGVDTDLFKPKQNTSEKIIVNIGRLTEKKGTCYLLQAFAMLDKKHNDTKLIIIGDGPLKQELQTLASTLQISDRVQFLGFRTQQNVLHWLQQASVFCLPTLSEGLGLVLLEAASCEVPVVASRVGGTAEAIKDNETGFLVPEKWSRKQRVLIVNTLGSKGAR